MKRQPTYSPEVRERAGRLVLTSEHDHTSRWAALQGESVASKIGCTAETLRKWIQRVEIDQGRRTGVTIDQTHYTKELKRENRELKQAGS
jgi:transposase